MGDGGWFLDGVLSGAGTEIRIGTARLGEGVLDGGSGAARIDLGCSCRTAEALLGLGPLAVTLGRRNLVRPRGAAYCFVITLPGTLSMSVESIRMPCSSMARSRCLRSKK